MADYLPASRYTLDVTGKTASRGETVRRPYTRYVVVEGDTLENIAARHFGDPLRYWEIADMNPQIKFPLDITAGTVLRLPT